MIQRIQNSKWVFVLISVFLAVIFWMYVRNDLDPPVKYFKLLESYVPPN